MQRAKTYGIAILSANMPPGSNAEVGPDRESNAISGLDRGIGPGHAIALNVTDMVGVGPFITLPLIVGAMGGPQ